MKTFHNPMIWEAANDDAPLKRASVRSLALRAAAAFVLVAAISYLIAIALCAWLGYHFLIETTRALL